MDMYNGYVQWICTMDMYNGYATRYIYSKGTYLFRVVAANAPADACLTHLVTLPPKAPPTRLV